MPFASSPSFHDLQTLFDSESMPLLDDHDPKPGDPDFIMLSNEEILNSIAAFREDEICPDMRAFLVGFFSKTINENVLAGPADAHIDAHVDAHVDAHIDESNDDELPAPQQDDAPQEDYAMQEEYAPQEETSADVQNGQGPQASFPTLDNFTAPVAGLPQLPDVNEDAYDPPHPPAVVLNHATY
ncbi:hypothetical protein EV702DRAFT_1193425 [Suillus placidus]|uniref:Uncharacterized protein n=1 Tax=Suillus placidus TaxID=48579 RepID=A0A9P7D6H0_9AGAM|nr:hypothetical protein EV702DRAFT_1193425 [Suillus placidus]